jgi:RNA polymerase sigma-70 factor (ECF subfamily)
VSEAAVRAHVERARAGDPEAFGALFQAFREDVERLCRRLLGSWDEARDATSESFLRARGGLEGYDPRQPFRRWLLAIAAHHCVDRLRRRGVEGRLFEPADLDAAQLAEPGPSALARVLRAETRDRIRAAVGALPDRYRAVVVLRFFAEFDYATIGEILGVERSHVGTLLLRARYRLRQELGSEPDR